jgi:hypothetical protein
MHRPADLVYPAPANDTQNMNKWALVGKHTLSYAGQVTVKVRSDAQENGEIQGELAHGPIIIANQPSWVGTTVYRNFTIFEKDNLLKITAWSEALQMGNSLFWKKLS